MTLLTFVFPPLFYMKIADATIGNKDVTERLDLFLNPSNEMGLKDVLIIAKDPDLNGFYILFLIY